MSSVRLRRLTADFQRLSDYVRSHPRLRLMQSDGDPPESYQIEYRIRSLRQIDGDLKVVKSHIVEINLPRNYPRTPPQCRMLSPVFHPNIAPHAICVGDHWSAGESLQSIVTRIGEMLAFQIYNVKSPLNGEAARWVDEHEDELPLDGVSLLVEEGESPPPPKSRSADSEKPRPQSEDAPTAANSDTRTRQSETSHSSASAVTEQPTAPRPARQDNGETIAVSCPTCDREYRVPTSAAGRNAKCQQCQSVFPIPK